LPHPLSQNPVGTLASSPHESGIHHSSHDAVDAHKTANNYGPQLVVDEDADGKSGKALRVEVVYPQLDLVLKQRRSSVLMMPFASEEERLHITNDGGIQCFHGVPWRWWWRPRCGKPFAIIFGKNTALFVLSFFGRVAAM
jgi:hypothetical protein